VTSDGGLILVRELDERLGFGDLIARHLTDSRANNARFPFADLLRQSLYSRLAGYEDVSDAERLSQDPALRLIGSEKIWDRGAALTSRLQTLETEILTEEGNFAGLARLNRELIGNAEAMGSTYRRMAKKSISMLSHRVLIAVELPDRAAYTPSTEERQNEIPAHRRYWYEAGYQVRGRTRGRTAWLCHTPCQ